jgi:RimJ/RimL family protein N-acetyltransferase
MNGVDLQPILKGELIELRPLRPDDWEALFAAASDPKIWEQHPHSNRYQVDVFRKFFEEALASGGALAAVDASTRRIIGSSRFVWLDQERGDLEIGWTFLERAYWGGRYNGEMKRLMLQHAFAFAERVLFVIGSNNTRSRRAVERIGATILEDAERERMLARASLDAVIYEIRKPVQASFKI